MSATINIENEIAIIEIENGKVNAINQSMIDAINSCLDEAEKKAKVVILFGGNGKFCGGFDLSVIKGDNASDRAQLIDSGGALVTRLSIFPLPVVVAADGHGVALGALFLLAADYRIGVKEGKYGLNETAIGMVLPDWGMKVAINRIPNAKHTQALLLANIYSGDDAVDAGFLDQTTETGLTLELALKVAEKLKGLPTATFASVKQILRA